ncbi:MAG: alanine racemase [Patescibacteria group bacterium]
MRKDQSHTGLRTWIEIDRSALEHNYATLRGLLAPQTLFMAVVKSNAYGHGLLDTAPVFAELGADWLGVDSIVEAETLRELGVTKPLFVLGLTLPEKIPVALEKNISLAISSFDVLSAFSKMPPAKSSPANRLKIHIKVDTGMHRQGFLLEQASELVAVLKYLEDRVEVEGLFTHFAAAKDPQSTTDTKKQIEIFDKWRKIFADVGFRPIVHAAASGGAIVFPEAQFDMVRFGIAIYGLYPSAETEKFFKEKALLQPALSWKTLIGEVKSVPAGDRTGYDFTETFSRDSKIAVCPIGYWHGFPRALSGKGIVMVHGRPAKVLGRVSMDMIVIDVTDIPEVQAFDEVTIIGPDAPVDKLAALADTSNYEFVTRINPLIKRIIV